MVECEFKESSVVACKKTVLIDTWWNVNKEYLDTTKAIDGVLIDTWWNVNELYTRYSVRS